MSKQDLPREAKIDTRYYVTMLAACELTKQAEPDVNSICGILKLCEKPIDNKVFLDASNAALAEYRKLGATDKVAKGQDLQRNLKQFIQAKFPATMKSGKPSK